MFFFPLSLSSTHKNSLCRKKELESFHGDISPDGRSRAAGDQATGSRVKCSHPWQGCGKCDPLSLSLSLSLSSSLLLHLLSLSLSSLLRSAASVQGTPAAGFWVCIYLSLNIGNRGGRAAASAGAAADRKRSRLSQILADWSGENLSK